MTSHPMNTLSEEIPQTIETLLRHRSIRHFSPAPVAEEHVQLAVAAGQQASTSSNLQAYSLLRIRERETLEALVELTGGQAKVARCGAFFIVCGDSRRHRLLAERAGLPYDSRLEAFLVSVIDASLFAQNLCVAFESLGYGICYIGGLRNDLHAVQRLMGFPLGVYPLFGLCVGVPAEEPAARPRLPLPGVLFEERYPDDATLLQRIAEYDAATAEYYRQRGAPATDWSSRIEGYFRSASRPENAAYYRGQGAHLD